MQRLQSEANGEANGEPAVPAADDSGRPVRASSSRRQSLTVIAPPRVDVGFARKFEAGDCDLQVTRLNCYSGGTGTQLLFDVDLRCGAGEMLAVMGPAASGKSLLLSTLAGVPTDAAWSGAIRVRGRRLPEKVGLLATGRAAYAPQNEHLLPFYTVREMLEYTAGLYLRSRPGGNAPSAESAVEAVLRELGLERIADRRLGSPGSSGAVSGGEYKRVSVASALLTACPILLLDEPISGVSASDALHIISVLRALCDERGYVVVLTVHQPRREILDMFDRVVALRDGRVLFSGDRNDLRLESGDALPQPLEDFVAPLIVRNRRQTAGAKTLRRNMNGMATLERRRRADTVDDALSSPNGGSRVRSDSSRVGAVFTPPFYRQLLALLLVGIRFSLRDWAFLLAPVLVDVITAVIVAGIYYRLEADLSHFTSYVAIGIMLLMIGGTSLAAWLMYYTRYRHRMHQEISLRRQTLVSYAVYWTVLLVARVVLQNVSFLLAAYWLAGMRNTVVAFFELVLIFVLGGWIEFALGMVMSAAGLPFGLALPATLLIWIIALVFSTGLVAADAFAKWARALSHASFMRHAIEAIAYSQLGGRTLGCGAAASNGTEPIGANGTAPAGCQEVSADTLLSLYGMSNNLGLHIGVLVIWIVIIMALVWVLEWASWLRLPARMFKRITGVHLPGSHSRASMLIRMESSSKLAEQARRAAAAAASTEAVAAASAEPDDADELRQHDAGGAAAADEPISGNGVGGGSDPINGQPFEFRFEGATFRTAQATILSGVSGIVRSGFMTAVLGASGAGKSTLLNVLFGIPLDGRIEATLTVNGARISSGLRSCAIAAISPQENALDPWQTVWEALRDAAVVRGRQPLIGELLHIFHMEGTEWRLIHTLSESERRRLAVAQAVSTGARLLLLDEPTTGLHSDEALLLVRTLYDLCRQRGVGVLATVHQPPKNVFRLFDFLLVLSRGQSVFWGRTRTVRRELAENPETSRLNPADWILDMLAADPTEEVDPFHELATLAEALPPVNVFGASRAGPAPPPPPAASWAQVYTLLWRDAAILYRIRAPIFQLLPVLILSLLLGGAYFKTPFTADSIDSVMGIIALLVCTAAYIVLSVAADYGVVSLPRHLRNVTYSRYGWPAVVLAVLVHVLLLALLLGVCYVTPAYWLIGFKHSFLSFLGCLGVLTLLAFIVLNLALTVYGLAPQLAPLVPMAVLLVLTVLAGFFVQYPNMPDWIRWLSYVNPLRAAYNVFTLRVISPSDQFQCIALNVTACPLSGSDVIHQFGFHSTSTISMSILSGWTAVSVMALLLCILLVPRRPLSD